MVRSARPWRVRDEHHVSPRSRPRSNLGDPVLHAAAELQRRLRGDVACSRPPRRAPASRARSPRRAAPATVVPLDDQRSPAAAPAALAPALRRRLARICSQRLAAVASRPRPARTRDSGRPARRQVVEEGGGPIRRRPGRRGPRLQRNDGRLVDRAGRALRRRVVGTDRLDRVADELEPDRPLARRPGRSPPRRRGRRTRPTRRPDPGGCSRRRRAGRRDRSARSRGPAQTVSAGGRDALRRATRAAAAPRRRRRSTRAVPVRRARAAPARAPRRCRSAARGRGRDRLRATETAGPTRSTSASERPSRAARKNRDVDGHPLDVGVGRHDQDDRSARRRDRGKERLGGRASGR